MITTSKDTEWNSPSFGSRRLKSKWDSFLREVIYLDYGVYNRLPRYKAIESFVNEGVFPFLEGKGYTWRSSEKDFINTVLNILFQMNLGKLVDIPNKQENVTFEHYDRFLQTLDSDMMEGFWYHWGQMADFQETGFGYRFRFLLQNLIWNNLSLEHSRVIQEFEEEIQDQRAFDEQIRRGAIPKGKDDPYLQDIQQGFGRSDKHLY